MRVEFTQYQYGREDGGRRSADGISFFLVDGQSDLTDVGAYGGALGYAPRTSDYTNSQNWGIEDGYLGIGLDAFGNYANSGHVGGSDCGVVPGETNNMYGNNYEWNPSDPNLQATNAISVRGPWGGTVTTGYCLLASKKLDSAGVNGSTTSSWGSDSIYKEGINNVIPSTTEVESAARRVQIIVKPGATGAAPTVSVSIDYSGTGNNFVPVLTDVQIKDRAGNPAPLPSSFKFGFASSTGGSTGSHLISGLTVTGDPTATDDSVTLSQWQPASFNAASLVTPGAFPIPATGAYSIEDPAHPGTFGSSFSTSYGTWQINTDTGAVTYTPTPGVAQSGHSPQVKFRATDSNGTVAAGNLHVTYKPTTGDEEKVVAPGATATFPPSSLDTILGSGTVASYKLLDPATGNPISTDTYTDSHGGVWTIDPTTGSTSYKAAANYRGPVDPIGYRLTDSNGFTTDGKLSIWEPPVGADQTKSATRGSDVTFDPAGDLVTTGSDGNPTVKLSDPDAGNPNKKSVPGQGVWTLDPATGKITFDPESNSITNVTPISYTVTDSRGQTDTGLLAVAYDPQTGDAQKTVEPGGTATFAPNDLGTVPGSGAITGYQLLDPATGNPIASNSYTDSHAGVWTINPATGETTYAAATGYRGPVDPITYRVTDANGKTADGTLSIIVGPAANDSTVTAARGDSVTFDPIGDLTKAGTDTTLTISLVGADAGSPNTKTVSGEGVWTLNPATGKITFAPAANYSGAVTPIDYIVTDGNGLKDQAKLGVIYPPATGDSVKTIEPGDTATFAPADLGTSGGSSAALTYTLLEPGTGNAVTSYADTHGGLWTIDPTTGETTYKSDPSYRGPVPAADYRVTDGNGKTADGNLNILIGPKASDETKTSNPGLAVSFDPVDDLTKSGSDSAKTISFVSPDASDSNKKTVPGEGTWNLVPATGVITFTPEPGYTGNPTPIDYRVTDGNTLSDTATLTVKYNQPPVAGDKVVTVNPGETAKLAPVITPGSDANLVASIDGSDAGDPTKKTVPGQGVWTIDPSTGKATFTPEAGFTSNPTPITYTVTDGNGLTDSGKLTVLVNQPPVDKDHGKTTNPGESVTFDPIGDLTTPGTSTDLEVKLVDPKTGKPTTSTTVTVPGEGVWTVDKSTGKVTFTPQDGFTGTATIDYQVVDGNGLTDTSTLSVTVKKSADTNKSDNTSTDDSGSGSSGDDSGNSSGNLPQTGAEITVPVVIALSLLLVGAGLVVVNRRRTA
ncbi:hypothetical protein GCM10010407_15610 [Rarobacter incanus]